MSDMWCVCFDCEGVLVGEAWLELQKKTGLDGLKLTTKDEPDYDKLMMHRIKILRENGVKLEDMKSVVETMEPLEGAVETISWLYPLCPRIIILTDTFQNYAQPLFNKLGQCTVFCHAVQVDDEGYIEKHVLRLKDQKRKSVEALKGLNFNTVAIGDSYNDISMLKAADKGILFRPGEKVLEDFPEFPVVWDHASLRVLLAETMGLPKPTTMNGK
ncbi:hypothetical protein FOL47_006520 [Perkinsus chesapeaki]|uniref:phosphoserine phosphatase n=1 Tax=Perkinsus chesapeaki TaxID=330153 RepID=A0A7J6LRL0_PERCH|nr:hypothetical protein FOL47_006520 [Perkinsus chesapeaki]